MTDISVVILVGNEELHIKRCLEKFAPLEPRQVFVVESQKGDNTHDVDSWSVVAGNPAKFIKPRELKA